MYNLVQRHVGQAKTRISLHIQLSTQSDRSLHCMYEESLGPRLPIEHLAKALIRLHEQADLSLHWNDWIHNVMYNQLYLLLCGCSFSITGMNINLLLVIVTF